MKRPLWLSTLPMLVLGITIALHGSGITSAAYSVIENAGSALTQRSILNFASGCTASDNAGANRTDVACSGGGSSLGITVNGGASNTPTTLNIASSGAGCSIGTAGTTTQTVTWTCSGGSAAGGVIGYSAPVVTLPAAGTTFIPPVGGGLPSSTETNVQATAPISSAISNMYVVMSVAIGAGNTIAFTYRDNASSQTVTCTISGASAKTCSDITHSFTPSVGDQLAIQIVTTGTVVATPNIQVTTQYGAIAGGGGTTVTAAPPYIELGTTFYSSWDMFAVTKPTAPTFLNSVACSTATTGTNGDLIEQNTSNVVCWGGYSGSTSVEADYGAPAGGNTSGGIGIWLYDSTNSHIYALELLQNNLIVAQWNYSGSGNPSFGSSLFSQSGVMSGQYHQKISLSAGTLTFSVSSNGGVTSIPIFSQGGIGTITKGGFVLNNITSIDLYSLVVN